MAYSNRWVAVKQKKIILELKYKGPSIPYPSFRSLNCILKKKKNDGESLWRPQYEVAIIRCKFQKGHPDGSVENVLV